MCGICGIVSVGRDPLPPGSRETVKAMCDAIVHRGPDDEGYYNDGRVALGMRRLSIIDLETGRQPISNEDGSVVTVFNGEIFNFPELRRELEDSGHRFATRSDTEVIVHLYEELGEEFVTRLNGMFAVAVWDTKERKLVLVRDRMGIKPLHILRWQDRLYFASEIKALLPTGFPREIDFEALSQYFTFEYIPAPRTIFKSVEKLLPAQMMTIRDGHVGARFYWDVPYGREGTAGRSEEDIAAELWSRLRESVRRRLISDVPLGVFLSGGIDSSAVTALMADVSTTGVKSYSIGFTEKSFNELPRARRVAEAFGTEHTEFTVDSGLARDLVPELMAFLDEPLADASVVPTFLISRLARKHVTVALAGDGGDELFAGYDTHKAFKVARLYRKVPRFIRRGFVAPVVRSLPAARKRLSFEFKAKKFVSGAEFPPELSDIVWWGAYTPEEKARLLSPDFQAAAAGDPFAPVRFHGARSPARDALDRICYLDLKLYLQDGLLVKVDRMSMANSLEIRTPFLDYTFVEFAASIPSRMKLKGFSSKHILKRALKGRVPGEILTLPKIGFDIPLGVWIRNELRDFVRSVLSPEGLSRHGFFDRSYVERILNEHMAGRHNHRQLLWPLIIFQFWHDRYLKGGA
ncbi:MAG: asparagine synthase (glutamine-hydrolyzing) [Candidatus Aminicenantes bacterium]|nr:asparagine synthase (glutamine-hydrolyzing) [Candidatus Aminicenantes bacterium]